MKEIIVLSSLLIALVATIGIVVYTLFKASE